jgi:predicted cupin superfamily sugar epimerase
MDLRQAGQPAEAVIAALGLVPHPEGGHYRETWRDTPEHGGRGVGTAIFFLLAAGEVSSWHRVDAAELWIWQAGAPLELRLAAQPGGVERLRLGSDLSGGEVLQGLVPRGHWQTATSVGAWTLVSCVVAPAFTFEGFELAPSGWAPA